MKSFVILASSLLLTSTCSAMNNPPKDTGLLLRRSAPPASTTQQMPGVKPLEELDLSKMSVNSRARYMTDFVAGELEKGQCSYEGTLIDLEGQLNAKAAGNSGANLACEKDAAILAWERADDDSESEEKRIASKVSSQAKYRPLGSKDRTVSAGPALQSIAIAAHAAHSPVGPSAADDSDDDGSDDSTTDSSKQDKKNASAGRDSQNDPLTFEMDDC